MDFSLPMKHSKFARTLFTLLPTFDHKNSGATPELQILRVPKKALEDDEVSGQISKYPEDRGRTPIRYILEC